MAGWFQGVAKRFPVFVVLVALMAAGFGVLAFFWAFRSCPLLLDEGTLLTYRLRTELRRDPDRPQDVLVDEQLIDIYCLNDRNDVALLARGSGGERISLLRLQRDGSAAPYRNQELQPDVGHAIGFFDFNLLPLPQDAHQSWSVWVRYGYLPEDAQEVPGRVRRVRNGPNPEFELRLDTVEWLEQEPYEHFRSMSDFVVRYRYDADRRIVDQAHLSCRYGLEGRSAARVADIDVHLELERWNRAQRHLAVRDLALATASVQEGRYGAAEERVVLQRLAQQVREHPRLRALAMRLIAGPRPETPTGISDASGGLEPRVATGPTWAVQVASVRRSRERQAAAVVAELERQGFRARLVRQGERLAIRIGPYPQREEAVLTRLRRLTGAADAFWVRAGP
ncbi:MAG: SPOR domain-containing protein [Planctomycetota bacterium]